MFGIKSFKGGVHPPQNKNRTENIKIKELKAPEKIYIPLSQHIGAPAVISVKRGDSVKIGQQIGESGGFVSSPVHSSVSGKVLSIGDFVHPLGGKVTTVEIENDGENETVEFKPLEKDWKEAAPGEIVKKISDSGIVGMGGAAFPTHVKLSPPSDKPIDILIINIAECEPYLTSDYRLTIEKTEEILHGVQILKKTLNANNAVIAIEDNKPEAVSVLNDKLSAPQFKEIKLIKLKTKYPQGGEKQLINAVTGREVPSGGLPMDVGCVVQNAGTTYAIYQAVMKGIPLYKRIVTVTGPAVKNPGNLLVSIGTPLNKLLEFCEIDYNVTKKIVMGGPMMGLPQVSLDTPVIKSTSGILALDSATVSVNEYECISCGNCVKVCPIHLVPSKIAKYVKNGMSDEAENWDIMDCMECGSCSYVCPSKINLVHYMKTGKYNVSQKKKKEKKS